MNAIDMSCQRLAAKNEKHIPGDEMIWLFLLGDMVCFALFFGLYSYTKLSQHAFFVESQQALNLHTGSLNTVLLLASSWFVVLSVKAARRQMAAASRWFLLPAFLCGAGFAVVKVWEYKEKAAAGINFLSNDFYLFYYLITGMHFAHVLIGLPLLLYFAIALRRDRLDAKTLNNLESSAIYWHMVDLLWIVIFPLIYLVQ
ncbi:cytochrome c oxidase subunit 3 [Pseudomonas sp. TCU-HL1]|uniref:cytochrome c oxidase subunit 3 n=1 Tax=Pseudomonas sp. TCU-HL1 TaxID=1856685 RepID=UPI0011AB746D|nr:cytochrome c oxidase subunit 3 [Pseudomonas sp. TCU-HL1]